MIAVTEEEKICVGHRKLDWPQKERKGTSYCSCLIYKWGQLKPRGTFFIEKAEQETPMNPTVAVITDQPILFHGSGPSLESCYS